MTRTAGPDARNDLARQVTYWQRLEEENRELLERVATALDDIREFVGRSRSDLERRKGRLLQTSGFRDETRGMEAALARIEQLLAAGRNISAIYAAIDAFLERYPAEGIFAREHTRGELAGARERFFCAFHESVRGTRLAALLDVLHFTPYSCWGARRVEKRTFRSPSPAEVLKVLEELGRRGVDPDALDTVQLAAIVRLKLGVTPRMEYHLMSSSKLAERLTDEEAISRFASAEVPPDGSFCRATAGILGNLRRWSTDFTLGTAPPPPELEAQMLQIVSLSGDTVRVSGTERERAVDFLWVLATVVAGTRDPLRDALGALDGTDPGLAPVRERVAAAAAWVDGAAARADAALLSRWDEARSELEALTASAEAIAAKTAREFDELRELERLKQKRSDVVKSLIKISESLQLIEPSLIDQLGSPRAGAPATPTSGHLRALGPSGLKERNRRNAEETRAIARQELEKLRALIARMTALSRTGSPEPPPRPGQQARGVRRTADGADLGALPPEALRAKLLEILQGAAPALTELKGRIEGVRKRAVKSDLQHALHQLLDRTAKAAEACDAAGLAALGADAAPAAAETIAPLLGDVMSAQTKVGARVNGARLTPAEKQPLLALLHAAKARVGEQLRDLERVQAELADRAGGEGTDIGAAAPVSEEEPSAAVPEAAPAVAQPAVPVSPLPAGPAPAETVGAPPHEPGEPSPAERMAALIAGANAGLGPVKQLLARVGEVIASAGESDQELREAARALQRGVTEARDLLTWNLMQIETIAAEHGLSAADRTGRFARWQGQLVAAGREADRLLDATEGVAALERDLHEAAELAEGIAETVRLLSLREVTRDDLLRLRERCLPALESAAVLGARLRGAGERLAAAAAGEWRLVKKAAAYLAARESRLAGRAPQLAAARARVEQARRLVESQLPPAG